MRFLLLIFTLILFSCNEEGAVNRNDKSHRYNIICLDGVQYFSRHEHQMSPKISIHGNMFNCNSEEIQKPLPKIEIPECKQDTIVLSPDNYFTQDDINILLETLPVDQQKETMKFLRKLMILDSLKMEVEEMVK